MLVPLEEKSPNVNERVEILEIPSASLVGEQTRTVVVIKSQALVADEVPPLTTQFWLCDGEAESYLS
jgi:hypothetical protein